MKWVGFVDRRVHGRSADLTRESHDDPANSVTTDCVEDVVRPGDVHLDIRLGGGVRIRYSNQCHEGVNRVTAPSHGLHLPGIADVPIHDLHGIHHLSNQAIEHARETAPGVAHQGANLPPLSLEIFHEMAFDEAGCTCDEAGIQGSLTGCKRAIPESGYPEGRNQQRWPVVEDPQHSLSR